jgi:hypothetical protein
MGRGGSDWEMGGGKLILDISSLEAYSNTDFLDLVLAVIPRALKRLLGIFLNTWPYRMKTGGNMARPSQDKFIKRQKELERLRKANEKMARRKEKKDNKTTESDSSGITDRT